jgi:site-specific recombinase XerD
MTQHTQIVVGEDGIGIRIYSQHSKDCGDRSKGAAYLKCNCWKWLQYQKGGKQIRESAKTRSYAGVAEAAKKKALELAGKPVEQEKPDVHTLEAAVKLWLEWRSARNKGNDKAEKMGDRLKDWMKENHAAVYLHEATILRLTAFFNAIAKIYAKDTSTSLKVHWSLVKGFFAFCEAKGMLAKSPLKYDEPIKSKKPEVIIPEEKDIEAVLRYAAAKKETEKESLFLRTMSESGMARIDTTMLHRGMLEGVVLRGRRHKTDKPFEVDLPKKLVEDLLASTKGEYFFWDGKRTAALMVQHWEKRLGKIFGAVKTSIRLHPHLFRHYYISKQLGLGFSADEVADMVGTSAFEIVKTYKHKMKHGRDRIVAKQIRIWQEQGRDANGDEITIQ